MPLNDEGYAHLTTHTAQLIDKIMVAMQAQLKSSPERADYIRAAYRGQAVGAQVLWLEATEGLSHPQDAANINEKVRAFYEAEK
ncbi:hypothetical protein [Pseudoduganella sp. R-34]|uniref:hypothetical protein n=1 Tax=Pseudoduganella sp. R-34 TaxID=3404062 RepID=UPI003CED56FD